MNPKHKAIEFVFGPIFVFLESRHITIWVAAILFNGIVAFFLLKQRKRGDRFRPGQIIMIIALSIAIGYAIYDQVRILKALKYPLSG